MLIEALFIGSIGYIVKLITDKPDRCATKVRKNSRPPESSLALQVQSGPSASLAKSSGDGTDRQIHRNLAVSASALVLTIAGALVAPGLTTLAIPLLLFVSVPVIVSAFRKWRKDGKLALALVDVLGLCGALIFGYYFIASLCATLFFTSQKLLRMTEDRSRKGLVSLFGVQNRQVWISRDGIEIEIPVESVQVGDVVVVDAGNLLQVDGVIIRGIARIDEQALTGESQPREKSEGAQVFAFTMVLEGRIHVRAEKAGNESVAAQLVAILNDTGDFTSSIQSRGQKIVEQGAVPTLAIGAITLPLLGPTSALAVFAASFGYHMRLAAPISALNFLRSAAESGILVKDGRALEQLGEVDTFLFDKTGTLTEEVPQVVAVHCLSGATAEKVLALAAAAEQRQTHPIAHAILREARARGISIPTYDEVQVASGQGLHARVGAQWILIGSDRLLRREGVAIPANYLALEESIHKGGGTQVYVVADQQIVGTIEMRMTSRPGAEQVVRALREQGYTVAVVSGDRQEPTRRLAAALNIDEYFAEVLPQDKAQVVRVLQERGHKVCFVGDGINDALALKSANVSISLRGASSIATDSASVILMNSSLDQILTLTRLAKELDENFRTGTVLTVAPGVVCVGSVYFLGAGLGTAVALYNIGLVSSIANAMRPRFKRREVTRSANS